MSEDSTHPQLSDEQWAELDELAEMTSPAVEPRPISVKPKARTSGPTTPHMG